jgi:hypothetical protein
VGLELFVHDSAQSFIEEAELRGVFVRFITITLLNLLNLTLFSQTEIQITNSSFDENLLLEGEWQTSLDGWEVTGSAGVFNPDQTHYTAENGDRQNVGYANNGSLLQILSETLEAGMVYTLTLEAGHRADTDLPPFTVRLVADGRVLAQAGGYTFPVDSWRPVTCVLSTDESHPIGFPLEIHLISSDVQTNFDNVSLTKEPFGASSPSGSIIESDLVLHVPGEYATIQDALAFLDDKRIQNNVTVTIQVADGAYIDYETVVMTHLDGMKIHIIGNLGDPSQCTITFKPETDGFFADGYNFGLIEGFQILGANQTRWGLFALNSGFIRVGDNLEVRNFRAGYLAAVGGTIEALNSSAVGNFVGYYSAVAGSIIANDSICEANVIGLQAESGGSMVFDFGSVLNNNIGIFVRANGVVQRNDIVISGNTTELLQESGGVTLDP